MKKRKRKAQKSRKVRPIPAGYRSITPYLSVRGAAQAIDFYKKAFGAAETLRIPGPEDPFGHVWHVATHIEDPSEAEVRRRLAKLAQQAGG